MLIRSDRPGVRRPTLHLAHVGPTPPPPPLNPIDSRASDASEAAAQAQGNTEDAVESTPSSHDTTKTTASEDAPGITPPAFVSGTDSPAASDASNATLDAAAAAAADALEPFRSVQGMGPAMLTSLLHFARAESGNREVVEALASEVRFSRPVRRQTLLSPGKGGGEGVSSGSWVEGKTVVFTGSLTR